MRKRRTHVGDDGRRAREEQCPADVGGRGEQDFAGLEQMSLLYTVEAAYYALDYPHRPGKAMDDVRG